MPAPHGSRAWLPASLPMLLLLLLLLLALCQPALGGVGNESAVAVAELQRDGVDDPADALHGPDELDLAHRKQFALIIDECIAVFLFGFLVVGVGMQYLVNYKDADIRSSVYKMISTTITIFCGVVITQAIFEFLIHQLLLSPQPRGLGLKEVGSKLAFAVGSSVFIFFLVLINFCSWLLWDSPIQLYAARNLLAHLCAFAGIRACDIVLAEVSFMKSLPLVLAAGLALAGIQVLLMAAASQGRDMLRRRGEKKVKGGSCGSRRGKAHEDEQEEEDHEEEPVWVEAAKEAEDEATVLISGFMASQVVCYLVMKEMIPTEAGPGEGTEFSEYLHKVNNPFQGLSLWTLLFFVMVFIMTYFRAICDLSGFAGRLMGNFHSWLTMAFAFCLLRLSTWLAINRWHNHSDLAYVICAMILSVLCIIAMIIIDAVADRIFELQRRGHHHNVAECGCTPTAAARGDDCSHASSLHLVAADEEGDSYRRVGEAGSRTDGSPAEASSREEADSLSPRASTAADRQRQLRNFIHRHLHNSRNTEKALRTVIAGLGIVIGLSWEIAFNVAEETIALQMNVFKKHPVLMKNGVAMALVAFILPGWMKFIAPMSLMHRDWHQKRIDQELEAEAMHPDLVPNSSLCVRKLVCALCCCCCGGCPSTQEAKGAASENDSNSDDSSSP